MHKHYDLIPGDERNYPAPFDPVEFRTRLAALDCDIEVRLAWAPDINRYEVKPGWDEHGNPVPIPVLGKQYAVMPKLVQKGWWVGDIVDNSFHVERHSLPGELRLGRCEPVDEKRQVWLDHRTGKVWIRDNQIEQIAFPRWVIEQKVEDQLAREQWEATRYDWVDPRTGLPTDETTPVRWDMRGPFPEEGEWRCYMVVAAHFPDYSCCKSVFPAFCYGEYKEPGEFELAEVRKSIWVRRQQLKLRGKAEPPTHWEVQEYIRKTMDEIQAGETRADQQVEEMLINSVGPAYAAHEVAFVDMGSGPRMAGD